MSELRPNPYLVLQVPPNADDKVIRRAYLQAIKQATPDHNPKRFQLLTEAYEQIKDETARNKYVLHDTSVPGQTIAEAFVRTVAWQRLTPLPLDQMQAYLRSCSKK